MVVELSGERRTDFLGVKHSPYSKDNPIQQIVREMISNSDVDYDDNSELFFFNWHNKLLASLPDFVVEMTDGIYG